MINAVQDTGNVAPQEKPVIEVFAWSTVMVFFANIGILIGIYLLGPIISVFVGRFGAALLAFFGVPFYAYYKVKGGGNDKAIRMELLAYSVLQGVLTGFVIDSIYLSYIPYAIVTPAIIAVSFASVNKAAGGNRKTLLGGTIGAAVGVNFVLGLLTGSLSFVYLLLTITYAGIAFVVMQVMIKNKGKSNIYQNALSCSMIAAKGMFFLMFGSYTPDDQQQEKQK